MILQMCGTEMELGGRYLGALRELDEPVSDADALRARLEEDGYVLIRGLHSRDRVLAARRRMLEALDGAGRLDRSHPLMDGVVADPPGDEEPYDSRGVQRSPEILGLVESPEIMGFFERLLGGEVCTFDFKWLRVIAPGANTAAHYDVVYMGLGTKDLYTCWTPIGDVSPDMGTLAILSGSHRIEKIRETYGEVDVDRDRIEGQFSHDPLEMVDRYGGQWLTTSFATGDALIFGMYTMHASLDNISNRFRLCADTRYQLASEPVDDRFMGEEPFRREKPLHTIEQMRQKWGV